MLFCRHRVMLFAELFQKPRPLFTSSMNNDIPALPKSRLAYILLALFLGTLGIHNFYAGYTGRGIAQLLLTLLSLGFLSLFVFIWVIVEICTVDKDAKGVPFLS